MSAKLLQPGDNWYGTFATSGTSGASVADALPTCVLLRNKVADLGVTVTVAQNTAAGFGGTNSNVYTFSATVPTNYASLDFLDIIAKASVGGVTGRATVDALRLVAGQPNSGSVSANVVSYADGQDPGTYDRLNEPDAEPMVALGGTLARTFYSYNATPALEDFTTTPTIVISRNGSNTTLVPTLSHPRTGVYEVTIAATTGNGFAAGDGGSVILTGTNTAGVFTKGKSYSIVGGVATIRSVTVTERDIRVS